MLKKVLTKLTPRRHVQIWEHRIKVTNFNTGQTFDEKPLVAIKQTDKGQKIHALGNDAGLIPVSDSIKIVNPFSHPRTLLSDFTAGEKLLQNIIGLLLADKWLQPSPIVIIHPMEKVEGGLTQIEDRALRELASGAGARVSSVYLEKVTSVTGFDAALELDEGLKENPNQSTLVAKFFFYLIMGAIILLTLNK